MNWEPAEQVAKNDSGQFVALIGGKWEPVAQAAKNDAGKYVVVRSADQPAKGERLRHASDSFLTNMEIPKPLLEIASGGTGLTRGALNLAGSAYDKLFGEKNLSDVVAPQAKPGLGDQFLPKAGDPKSGWNTVGAMIDPVAWGIAGGAGHLAKLPGIGGAFAPGGYAKVTGQGVLEGLKATGRNVATGAATGGAIGGLSDDGDAGTGAAVGAAANVVLPPALAAAAKGLGSLWDVMVGRLGAVNAAKILREAAGSDLPAIKAAMVAAPDDLTATQAASRVISRDTWNALGELAKRKDRTNYFTNLAERQKQEVLAGLQQIAGGANQTSSKQSQDLAKKILNDITGPMREVELAAANAAGTTGSKLQREATALGEAASSKVADVRRIGRAGEIAERVGAERPRLGEIAPPVPGLPRTGSPHSYGTELAQLADRIATQPAADSLVLGQAARFKQMQADSLAAHGLKPLSSEGVVRSIDAKLRNPRIGADEINSKVLARVRDRIAEWTNADGIIDASALYGIRKSAVNDAIEQLMGAADPKAKARRAAGVLSEVRPLIDNAIEEAGGTGWRRYLATFENGMRKIEQQRMGAKALDLFERTPAKLESLAAGNEPRMVEKIFGTEYDLAKAMGPKAAPIERAAGVLSRDRLITESAARGEGGLAGILAENTSKFKLPNWINAKVALTNRALDVLETQVNKSTMNKVYEAMRTGQSAAQLIDTLPTVERNKVLMAIARSRNAPYTTAGAAQVATE